MSPLPDRARRTARRASLVVVLLVALAACRPPLPSQDPFFDPGPPPANSEPGDILAVRPSSFTVDPVALTPVPGVDSWQIQYRSTDALGEPTVVSGTVLVPTLPWLGWGPRPVVTYSVGTRGLGDDCAPSYTLTQGTDYEGPFIAATLAKGWAVVVTDYEGLGNPGTHTYMVGPSQGHAVLDAARAALALPEARLADDAPIGIMGYSQGGAGAGWAAELAATYAPELDVVGTVAGGVPGDLGATADFLDGSLFVSFALMASLGLDTAYPELDIETYLNGRGQQLVQTANELCLVSVDGFATLIDTAFTDIDDYVTTNPLGTAAWQARLDEVALGDVAPSAPVFQYHGVVDEIVPFGQAADLRRDWCDAGATVTWSVLPGEHLLGLVEGHPLGLTWLSARFSGLPTAGTCALP